MKRNQKLETYRAPKMNAIIVELEDGLAAASATITPGGPGATNNYNPEVDDWVDDPGQSGNLDM